MKTRLGLLMVLALLAAPFATLVAHAGQEAGPLEGSRQPAPWNPAAPQAPDVTYLVDWNITASGQSETQSSGCTKRVTRRISISGDAVCHDPAQGQPSTIPMNLTVTDNGYESRRCPKSGYDKWTSIVDPSRYAGGPDPWWSGSSAFAPYHAPDGTWSMTNPFIDWTFAQSGQLRRYYNYREDLSWYDEDDHGSSSQTDEWAHYADILRALKDMPLIGDDNGTVFKLTTEYTVSISGIPLTVNFDATVSRAGCTGLGAPIDIANPGLKFVDLSLQAEDTTPDGEAALQARVTCQGIPVVNAPVVVKLKAVEGSGGHNHRGGKRPRGYIDGEEQTAETKFIGLTGGDGAVTFAIAPGRDLTDKSRGIAGLYSANAWIEWEGVSSPAKRAYIDARLHLVPLPESGLYSLSQSAFWQQHPQPFHGTRATVERVQELAQRWTNIQLFHNLELELMGEQPWSIDKLEIGEISLPQGGLFDREAAFSSKAWRPPLRQHRFGVDVGLLSPAVFLALGEQLLWYEREFRDLGNRYGTWFSEPAGQPYYHLKLTKAAGYLPASSMSAPRNSSATDPDVAASAALVDPQRRVAGAGQTVTYAVGVENVISSTVASQVELKAALPTGLSFVSADPPQSRMEDPRTPVWEIGDLPGEGAPRAFEVMAQVDPSLAAGTVLTVTATATTGSPDADPANDQFDAWGLTVQQPGPDLVIGSNLDATALVVREPVTFTIGLSNDGNAPASNSWFDLTAPTGITITQTSPAADVIPGSVRWDAGELMPGQELTATVVLQVDPALLDLAALSPDLEPEYPLSFVMAAGSDDSDIDPASNQLQVDKRVDLPGPDLLVALQAEGTPGPGVFEVGQTVTYTLLYANVGNRVAAEAGAALLLWPGLTLVDSQPAPATNELDPTSGVRTLAWDLGDLPVGEEGTIQLRLRVDDVPEAGSILQANIRSDNIDSNPADNVVMETRLEAIASHEGEYQIYVPLIERQ